MPKVVALGDVNVDIIAHFGSFPAKGEDALAVSTEIQCGGSAANTATALARMGIETSLIARIGPDSWALKVLGCLDDAGVSPSGLQRDPVAMTGMMYVVVTPDGERTILGHRGANVYTDPDAIDETDFRAAHLFHLSGYALLADPQRSAALRALEVACHHNLQISLDPGMSMHGKALEEMRALLPVVDFLFPSLAEARHLTGLYEPEECARTLRWLGVKVVALKLGRDGCLIASDNTLVHVPGFSINVRDSTGAGDNFAAGFLAGVLGDLDWRGAAVLGNAMGAMCAACVGSGAAVPKARALLNQLREGRYKADHPAMVAAVKQVIDYVTTLAIEPEEGEKPWWK